MALPHQPTPRGYEEIVELFASGPNVERIVAFEPSSSTKQRVSELLKKSKASILTDDEQAELDQFEHVEHLMRLVKARARARLGS